MVMTEMAESIPPAFLNAAVKETVLGRIASSDDVAHVIAFFCSDFSRHITGEVIKVDGGQYI
jgi:3-oxoacyl-[acyl-carrier protein] reductase